MDFNNLFVETIILKLFFLTFSGLILRQFLVISGQRWANTYHHLGTYVLLPNIALIITTVIKNDIALSLGMIGALSIIRFRNPVKSPFELVMFFSLLTLGIVCSVSGKLSLLLFVFIAIVIIGIKFFDIIAKKFNRNIYQFSFGDGNLVYTLEINSKISIIEIEQNKCLIQMYEDHENNNFFYRLAFTNKDEMKKFQKIIYQNKNILNIKTDFQS